jgi:hypothetical protein
MAKIRLVSGYLWLSVEAAIREALFDSFGFNKRLLGQPAYLSEIIALIQGVPGVDYVCVDAFYGAAIESTLKYPEQNDDLFGKLIEKLLRKGTDTKKTLVNAHLAKLDPDGSVRPAQLVVFNSDIPQSVILNQIMEQ